MLVLFVVFTIYFNARVGVLEEERMQVQAIQNATQSLDPLFF